MQCLMCYSQPGSGGGGVLIYGPAITCDTHRAASGKVSLLLTEEKKSQLILRGAGGRRAGDADEREFQEGGIGSWGH